MSLGAPTANGADAVPPLPTVHPGRVVSWGGPDNLQSVLAPPADLDDAVAIAASDTSGEYSNLALRSDGTVVGWGLDKYGEASPPADLTDVAGVDMGAGFSLALRSDGSVVAWGTNDSGQLDVPATLGPVTAISAGGYFGYRGIGIPDAACGYALALRADGTVARWGQNTADLGCDYINSMNPPAGLDHVVAVSAGARQALALRDDGTVVTWGTDISRGLDGTSPELWSDVVAVSVGSGRNILGLRSDGTVLAYGIWGESGPPRVSDVAAISASNTDVFLHRDGTISTYRSGSPSIVPGGDGFQAVSAGYDYLLAIAAATPQPTEPVLGSTEVQPSVDSNPSGMAEAFQYRATGGGTVTAFHVFLDERSEADRLIVGVYADAEGRPGARLATGRSRHLVAGSWNSVPIRSTTIAAGQKYWLAILSPVGSGTIRFRDLENGNGGPTQTSRQDDLTARCGLPRLWEPGTDHANSPASLYLS